MDTAVSGGEECAGSGPLIWHALLWAVAGVILSSPETLCSPTWQGKATPLLATGPRQRAVCTCCDQDRLVSCCGLARSCDAGHTLSVIT